MDSLLLTVETLRLKYLFSTNGMFRSLDRLDQHCFKNEKLDVSWYVWNHRTSLRFTSMIVNHDHSFTIILQCQTHQLNIHHSLSTKTVSNKFWDPMIIFCATNLFYIRNSTDSKTKIGFLNKRHISILVQIRQTILTACEQWNVLTQVHEMYTMS